LKISLVPEGAVKIVWKDVERLLRKSVDTVKDKSGTIDILDGLFDGTYVLWVVMDEDDALIAAFTTRLIVYPQRKALGIDWVGGSRMSDWASDMIETMRRYAREQGCDHIEGYGRKGWTRYLEKYGFYPEYVAYRMELSNGQEQTSTNGNNSPSNAASRIR
jgi:GNAT superfamily N-acetyltransferase